jgi:hypothetical protein
MSQTIESKPSQMRKSIRAIVASALLGLTLQQSWTKHEEPWGLGLPELERQGLNGYNCRLTPLYRR